LRKRKSVGVGDRGDAGMADGYLTGKSNAVDTKWWMEQVTASTRFRRKKALEDEWGRFNQYYRGDWDGGVMPVNMFFAMLRATVPRVYFRNPAISVTPAQSGFLNMAFAQILGRMDNKMIRQMKVKRQIRMMVQDVFLKGTGIGKLGYGTLLEPSGAPNIDGPATSKTGERFEYNPTVQPGFPWFRRLHAGRFYVPDGLEVFEDARWVAELVRRPKDDVIRDPRLKGTKDIPPSHFEGVSPPSGDYAYMQPMVDLVEFHDRKFNKVFIIAPMKSGDGKVVYEGTDFLSERRLPYFPLIFNDDDEAFWGIPDATILEPSQLELNEINTQIMKHRRISMLKFLYRKGRISNIQLEKLMSEDVGAGVEVEGSLADVTSIQAGTIPRELIEAKSLVIQDIRDQLGFSRNQLGEFQSRRGDTSATEAAIVQQGSDIRVDERKDMVADMLVEIVQEMHEIIFRRWNEEQVVQLVGPGGVPIWVQVKPTMLSMGRYEVSIDPDTGAHKTRSTREQKALSVYEVLKANPLIDPMKLTQYLLTELEGVEMDDLMQAMPPVSGVDPGQMMNPAQYSGLLKAGFQGLQASGPNPPSLRQGS